MKYPRAANVAIVGVLMGLAYIAGAYSNASDEAEHRRYIEDSLLRIAHTEYALLDTAMRNLHYAKPHKADNPWCPECYELLNKLNSHGKVVESNEDLEEK